MPAITAPGAGKTRGFAGAMIPLYSICTPSHHELRDRFFLPTLPPGFELEMLEHACEGAGWIMDAGWRATIIRKVEWIIEAVRQQWGGFFLFSDVDVQFFGDIHEPIHRAAKDFDICFQRDTPSSLCTGFFVCRGNEAALDLWSKVLGRVRATDGFKHDQDSMQTLIGGSKAHWGFLPSTFFGGGTFTNKIWNPGDALPIPDQALMHHANFTCGVPNKVKQCEYVQGKVSALSLSGQKAVLSSREAMPNDAEIERLLDELFVESGAFPCSTERETGAFLASLIRLLRSQRVLELGAFKGATTIQFVRALSGMDEARVVTVDCVDVRSPALRKLDRFYSFVQGRDVDVVPKLGAAFDFVYLDTVHTYEHTKAQIATVRAHSPRAVIAVHDVLSHPAVAHALAEFTSEYSVLSLPTPPQPDGRVNGLAILSPTI